MSHTIARGDTSERGVIPGTGFILGESFHADGDISVASQQDGGWHLESPVRFGAVQAGKAVHRVMRGWQSLAPCVCRSPRQGATSMGTACPSLALPVLFP